jgi:Ser-tRNA(Ala) deacylase AlaX
MQEFLSQFGLFADQYKLQLDIKAQEELIKKTIKEYDKLVEEGKKIQQEMELNKSAQESKNNDIITLQQALSILRGKLK